MRGERRAGRSVVRRVGVGEAVRQNRADRNRVRGVGLRVHREGGPAVRDPAVRQPGVGRTVGQLERYGDVVGVDAVGAEPRGERLVPVLSGSRGLCGEVAQRHVVRLQEGRGAVVVRVDVTETGGEGRAGGGAGAAPGGGGGGGGG